MKFMSAIFSHKFHFLLSSKRIEEKNSFWNFCFISRYIFLLLNRVLWIFGLFSLEFHPPLLPRRQSKVCRTRNTPLTSQKRRYLWMPLMKNFPTRWCFVVWTPYHKKISRLITIPWTHFNLHTGAFFKPHL